MINNRPDGEAVGQPSAADMSRQASELGLAYEYVPSTKLELFCDPTVEAMAEVLASTSEPVIAHCLSGMRSAIIWAAAEARRRPVSEVLADLDKAGFELDFLRDELDQQAALPLSRSTVRPAAPAFSKPRIVHAA